MDFCYQFVAIRIIVIIPRARKEVIGLKVAVSPSDSSVSLSSALVESDKLPLISSLIRAALTCCCDMGGGLGSLLYAFAFGANYVFTAIFTSGFLILLDAARLL